MIAWLRNLVLDDFWLKLFSFTMAVLIWLTVSFAIKKQVSPIPPLNLAASDERTLYSLPVVVMSSAEDVRGVRVNPKEVQVTVRGDAKSLKELRAQDIRVIVDLTGIEAAHDLRKRIEVTTPAGVTHVRIEPPEVQVVFPPRT